MEFRFPLLVLALGPCESVKAFDDGEFRPCAVHCLGEPYGRMVLGLLDELTVESFGCFACFFMADGFQNLFLAHWNAELVHDLGERADLYKRTAMSFVERGYSTYAFDLRGHGRSGRRLGHAPGFTILVKDLLQFLCR